MDHLTTRQVGELTGQPEWLIRRVVDSLTPPVQKFAHRRAVPRERLPEVEAAIEARLARRNDRQDGNRA